MNIGYSSRSIYDECAYQDRTKESTDPFLYRLNPNSIHNCEMCFSALGPRSSRMGEEVSTTAEHQVATAQYLTDVESVLTNRNLPKNKCRNGEVNPIDVTKLPLHHLRSCGGYLDPMASRLSYPPFNYREMAINRFHDLPTNPQEPIFYDFAVNSKLEAKDNFVYSTGNIRLNDPTLPSEFMGESCFNPRIPCNQ